MKKIMFNHHFGLEQAVLNRTKTRTMRKIGLTCTNINTLEDIPINEYTMINEEPYFNIDSV